MTQINIGLDDNARKAVAASINGVLADSYAVYFQTHSYHWNVTGPQFKALHDLFEEQYTEIWTALDAIAERVRALGAAAPASPAQLSSQASINVDEEVPPQAAQMVENLLKLHGALLVRLREALSAADAAGDAASEDLLTQRIDAHEKAAWMLRAINS